MASKVKKAISARVCPVCSAYADVDTGIIVSQITGNGREAVIMMSISMRVAG